MIIYSLIGFCVLDTSQFCLKITDAGKEKGISILSKDLTGFFQPTPTQ